MKKKENVELEKKHKNDSEKDTDDNDTFEAVDNNSDDTE